MYTHSFCRSKYKLDISGNYEEAAVRFNEPTMYMDSSTLASECFLYRNPRQHVHLRSILGLIPPQIPSRNVPTPQPHSVPSTFQYLLSSLSSSNTGLKLPFGPHYVGSPSTSSALHCVLFLSNLTSSTL